MCMGACPEVVYYSIFYNLLIEVSNIPLKSDEKDELFSCSTNDGKGMNTCRFYL